MELSYDYSNIMTEKFTKELVLICSWVKITEKIRSQSNTINNFHIHKKIWRLIEPTDRFC